VREGVAADLTEAREDVPRPRDGGQADTPAAMAKFDNVRRVAKDGCRLRAGREEVVEIDDLKANLLQTGASSGFEGAYAPRHSGEGARSGSTDAHRTEKHLRCAVRDGDIEPGAGVGRVHRVEIRFKAQACRGSPAEHEPSGARSTPLNGHGALMERHRFIGRHVRIGIERDDVGDRGIVSFVGSEGVRVNSRAGRRMMHQSLANRASQARIACSSCLARRQQPLEAERHGLVISEAAALLLLHDRQRMTACETPHLLEALNRDERRQRLALALGDELVVPEGDAIQHVADVLANLHRGDLVNQKVGRQSAPRGWDGIPRAENTRISGVLEGEGQGENEELGTAN
jgi:hypothetical protein